MAISVEILGHQYYSGGWHRVSNAYIGRESSSIYDMTEFKLTLDKDYSSITLTFTGSDTFGISAKWGAPNKPESPSDSGIASISTAAVNNIVMNYPLPAGTIFSVYVWSSTSLFQVTKVVDAYANGAEPTPRASASIGTGSGWANYTISIGTGSGWTNYTPSFGTGTGWTT